MTLITNNTNSTLTKQLKNENVFNYFSNVFQKFGKTREEINISTMKNT